jgi:hypothetical protein
MALNRDAIVNGLTSIENSLGVIEIAVDDKFSKLKSGITNARIKLGQLNLEEISNDIESEVIRQTLESVMDEKLGDAEHNYVTPANELNIDLNLITDFEQIKGLPSISSTFNLNWSLTTPSTLPNVVFKDVNLELGSFFGNDGLATKILNQVDQAFEPIRPVINALTYNINFFTDPPFKGLGFSPQTIVEKVKKFAGDENIADKIDFNGFPFFDPNKISVLDLLYIAGTGYEALTGEKVGVDSLKQSIPFIKAVNDFSTLVDATSNINGALSLGEFSFNLGNSNPSTPANSLILPQNITPKLEAFGNGLKFPILETSKV